MNLAKAVATQPFDRVKVASCLAQVENVGGKGLAAEATSTAAMFMAITKVADATCKKPVDESSLTPDVPEYKPEPQHIGSVKTEKPFRSSLLSRSLVKSQ